MVRSRKMVVLHEAHYPRQLLYTRALENIGVTVAPARAAREMKELLSNSTYLLVVVSVPDEAELRQQFLEDMQGLVITAPLVVLDGEPFNFADFGSLPVQAHFRRSAVHLSEVIARIADMVHGG